MASTNVLFSIFFVKLNTDKTDLTQILEIIILKNKNYQCLIRFIRVQLP